MKHSLDCSGAYFAFQAAIECPVCFLCDAEIPDVSKMYHTTRGKPLCRSCRDNIEDQMNFERTKAFKFIMDPRETRASALLRTPNVNPHDS